jgi:1-pyrroline-5-carboxylate dehydrogenase
MCGNVVVWKPANTQVYGAQMFMKILKEAGLPDGVINLIYVSGPTIGNVCFNHRDFAGVHFTGSTGVFNNSGKQLVKIWVGIKHTPVLLAKQVVKILC